jgi:hypothetical protein
MTENGRIDRSAVGDREQREDSFLGIIDSNRRPAIAVAIRFGEDCAGAKHEALFGECQ